MLLCPVLLQQTAVKEYEVKALFLYNFAQFIEWPDTSYRAQNAPFVIAVLGDDPFGSFLDNAVKGENISGHPLTIKRYRKPEDVTACNILYISHPVADKPEKTLGILKGRSILTVADTPGFANAGGMINFSTVDNRIHFQVNLDAARAANLKISSKLLRLADIVEPN